MIRIFACFVLLCAGLRAQPGNLNIYWIDVEGGARTLIVAPGGQSLLVDTGNPAPDDRDAKRIYKLRSRQGSRRSTTC